MKEQTNFIRSSQQSLVLVSLIFFVMAFACKDSKSDIPPNSSRSERTSGGRCSTEAEFRDIIADTHSNTYGESSGKFQETEIIFKTFRVGAATRYRNPQYSIDASPAYPVDTDYTVRDFLGGETKNPYIREQDHSVKFICYVDIYDKCVCYDEGRRSGSSRQIPYDR